MIETTQPMWLFFCVAALCVVFVGIAKAGFAGGVGVIATPLMSLVTSPLVAAAILLPLLCACDLVSIYYYRRIREPRILRMLLPGSAVGILVATFFLWKFRDHKHTAEFFMNQVIGWTSLLFVATQLARPWIARRLRHHKPGPLLGHLLGVVAGFSSTLSHAGGPPVTMFLLPQGLDRTLFVGTTVWFFTCLNFAKLLPYWWLGMLQGTNLRISALLLPLVPVGVLAGIWLNRHMSQRVFNAIVYGLLIAVGLQLITGWDPISWLHHQP